MVADLTERLLGHRWHRREDGWYCECRPSRRRLMDYDEVAHAFDRIAAALEDTDAT